MAAIARIGPSFERPNQYIDTNFNGTYEMVKFCIKNNIPGNNHTRCHFDA